MGALRSGGSQDTIRRSAWPAASTCCSAGTFVGYARLVAAALTLLLPPPAQAQWRDSYEALEATWKLADYDCGPRVLRHERTFDQAHTGQASEHVRLVAGNGSYVHLVTPLPPSRIIDELTISVWIKANRPGLQLAARAVLPRSLDSRTGRPLTTLIHGEVYEEIEKWQKLTMQLPAKLLSQKVPILRSQFGSDVSPREAYVDMLVLNAYGGPGDTQLWLDDLEISGQVLVENLGSAASGDEQGTAPHVAELGTSKSAPAPRLHGSVLVFEDRPQLVRAVTANGESFAHLRTLGFNAVCLSAPPTPEQLREADECGIWLIVPPPAGQSPLEYGTSLDRILAWDLGRQLAVEHVEPTRRLAQSLRSVPDEAKRALICLPREEIWQYSRIADLVVLEPPGPHGSLPLADYGAWYLQRARLARMGARFWASIATQMAPSVAEQVYVLGGTSTRQWTLEPEQIRLQTYHAVASGANGLLFQSHTRLDATDRLSDLRAKTLKRLNQELSVIEPWAATGNHEAELDTGDASVRASVLRTDRSRLVLVIRRAANQQFVVAPMQPRPVRLEVPRVPETDEVYLVGDHGLRRIPQQRGTGLRLQLEEPSLINTIVVTQDPLVINFLARQSIALRQDRARLVGDIAAQMYAAVVETHQQLLAAIPAGGLSPGTVENEALGQARQQLQQFQQLVEGGGHDRAYEFLHRGRQQLAMTRYQDWQQASQVFPSPVASPLCVSFFTLPQHYALGQRLRGATWGPNALAGGDFENMSLLQSSGWTNRAGNAPELATSVELSLHAPHAGRSSLRLQCWPRDTATAPTVIESPPLVITSGPIPVRRGQIVRIEGWARVPQAIQGTMDGLLLYDSLTGRALAERIRLAPQWRRFTFYRAATRDGAVTVAAALCGMGEAWLDDITAQVLDPPRSQAQIPIDDGALPRR